MHLFRPTFAPDPRCFGRRAVGLVGDLPMPRDDWSIPADLKLFATTFLAGFLFVSVLIG